MARKHEEYNEIMSEMLDLAGVTMNEEDIDVPDETDLEGGFDDDDDEEEDKKNKGEINDRWESKINSKGEFKIEFYDNFIYIYYKNRKSSKISIDPKLRPYKKLVSKLINKIFGHIEKTS